MLFKLADTKPYDRKVDVDRLRETVREFAKTKAAELNAPDAADQIEKSINDALDVWSGSGTSNTTVSLRDIDEFVADSGTGGRPELPDNAIHLRQFMVAWTNLAEGIKPGAQEGLAVRLRGLFQTRPAKTGLKPVDLATLTSGVRRVASGVEDVLGARVTAAGLKKMYATALPHAKVELRDISVRDQEMEYTVVWSVGGKEVATTERTVTRHSDESLELHHSGVWVDPAFRGFGVSAKVIANEKAMLQQLSTHELSRLTLNAGGMNDVTTGKDFTSLGGYTWANFGFDFVDSYDIPPLNYGPRSFRERVDYKLRSLSDVELLRHHFDEWLDTQARDGQIPNDAELIASIKEAARAWRSPWDVSTFDIPSLRISINIAGKPSTATLGKAYLTSGDAPDWRGVHFVNEEGRASEIQAEYVQRTLARIEERQKSGGNGLNQGGSRA